MPAWRQAAWQLPLPRDPYLPSPPIGWAGSPDTLGMGVTMVTCTARREGAGRAGLAALCPGHLQRGQPCGRWAALFLPEVLGLLGALRVPPRNAEDG